jgi:hypothetical protein
LFGNGCRLGSIAGRLLALAFAASQKITFGFFGINLRFTEANDVALQRRDYAIDA